MPIYTPSYPLPETRLEGLRVEMLEPRTYKYKSTGNCEIRADVHGPPDVIQPAILWMHGGALLGGGRADVKEDQLRLYAEAGYKVVSIDYRLAPESKLDSILADIRDAWSWLRGEAPSLGIDRERVGLVGHSAGGYLVLSGGYLFDPPPRAIVSFYGYGDVIGPWYSQPDPFYCSQPAVSRQDAYSSVGERPISETSDPARWNLYLHLRQTGRWPEAVTGLNPEENREGFGKYCPVRNVAEGYPPTILVHGRKDTDVPYEQSVSMARELDSKGVDFELIIVAGAGHGFDGLGIENPDVKAVFVRVLAFLKRYMRQ